MTNKMQYLTKTTPLAFKVRLDGPEQEQEELAVLSHNLFNAPSSDSYSGKIITFQSNKQFKNLLFWRGIFNKHDPNKRFSFMPLARESAKEVQEIFKSQVFSIDRED